MPYPSLEQYNQAFQLHARLLADPELKSGTVTTTGLGLPHAISGGFALTYTIRSGQKKYAVRCFHRESKALERRYSAISKRLSSLHSPYFLDFQFQPKGISVDGTSYPVVKMAWAQGETLGEFLESNYANPSALSKLSTAIGSLAGYLEREKIAHGDIQTGNLMVSVGGSVIQLIDYDGMYVEEIKDLGSAELGHVNFQHPLRKVSNPFAPTIDRFSFIALSLALKALQADKSLWAKTSCEVDAVLFRANDFIDPGSSSVFALLSANSLLALDAKHFASVCKSSVEKVPSLSDFLAGRNLPTVEVKLAGTSAANYQKPGYIGAYAVLSALDYNSCLRHVGDKVEVIGQILEVKEDRARNGKTYVFINFGDWRGQIFKISLWSEGLAVIKSKPDASWKGKWISVVGLMEPPYVSRKYKYSHLSISVTNQGQFNMLSDSEAKWRLSGSTPFAATPRGTTNRDTLDRIKSSGPNSVPTNRSNYGAQASSTSSNQSVLNKIRSTGATATNSSQARTTPNVPPAWSTSSNQPSSSQPRRQQKPPEKGVIEKIFSWIFG